MTAGSLKILILEDNEADAEMILRLLKKHFPGWQFKVVDTKQGFSNALDNYIPDVIISDNTLPQFNASGALVIAKNKMPHVPFILVTGTITDELAATIVKAGADDYLLKDRLTRLPTAIQVALEKRRIEKEKMDATEKLRRSEENYRTLVERVSDAFVALDNNYRFTYVNKKAGNIFNISPGYLTGQQIWDVLPEHESTPLQKACAKALKTQQYVYVEQPNSHSGRLLEDHIYPSPNGLSVFIRDITDRKKAEEAILETNEKLRRLTNHLQTVREEERKRIGREIHDELGQQLTAIKMDVAWLDKTLKDEPGSLVKQKLHNIMLLLEGSNQAVRRILTELRPVILETSGLLPAVKWLADQFTASSGIPVQLKASDDDGSIDAPVTECIFRVFQETFTNIARYSTATAVSASMTGNNEAITASIKDNGKGFDPSAVKTEKSFGITGMRERVLSMGGNFTLASTPGKGTKITFTVPRKLERHDQ